MAVTQQGAIKIAAAKLGIPVKEYLDRLKNGKWCTKGKHWAPRGRFCSDKSRTDGLSATCNDCRRVKNRKSMKGQPSAFKGKRHTDAAKKAMSEKRKGVRLRLGKTHTIETRIRISTITRQRTPKGSQCKSFKDGKFAERMGLRFSSAYKQWRYDVYSRDKFTCQECGDDKGGNLNAHHIKHFADFPELRFDVSNGITLCETCHKKRHVAAA